MNTLVKLTRIAVGRSGVLRVETNDRDITLAMARGVTAHYDEERKALVLQEDLRKKVPKGRKSKFHQYSNGVHHLSVPLSPADLNATGRFRIAPVDHYLVTTNDDDVEIVVLPLPQMLRPPKGFPGYTRTPDLPRERHPLSHDLIDQLEDQIGVIDPLIKPFDPTLVSRMSELLVSYCAEYDVEIKLDENGELYGRIDLS